MEKMYILISVFLILIIIIILGLRFYGFWNSGHTRSDFKASQWDKTTKVETMKHLPVQPTVTYSTQIDDTKVIISYDFYLKKYDENTKNLDDKIKSKLFLDAMDQEINSTKNSNADISKIEKLTNSYGHVNLRDILTENNGNEICLYSVEIGQCLEYFTIHDYGFQAAPLAGTGQIIYFTPDGIMFHKDEWIS